MNDNNTLITSTISDLDNMDKIAIIFSNLFASLKDHDLGGHALINTSFDESGNLTQTNVSFDIWPNTSY